MINESRPPEYRPIFAPALLAVSRLGPRADRMRPNGALTRPADQHNWACTGGWDQKNSGLLVPRHTVDYMSGPADYQSWLERYADYYDTDADREAGYRDYLANHADMTAAIDGQG